MRVCLLSITYPPLNTEGIARQRQVLATELARQGHDVQVITCGSISRTRCEQGVWVHEVGVAGFNRYAQTYPGLDGPLTYSQALYEGFQQCLSQQPCDIVDIPLWLAQGFIPLQRYQGATVVWLQTTAAQMQAINRQDFSPDQAALVALERKCMESAGGLLADSHVAWESTVHDYGLNPHLLHAVAHLGLPPLADPPDRRHSSQALEALVVGRLEKRKGTPLLFAILPQLLRRYPQLNVRFVGRDNSANDGWHDRYGVDYPTYFLRSHPDLSHRVHFEGYVDDQRLEQCYRQADMLLAPSLYESFGLIYLEAMRAALPVIAFAAGGATEIFAAGEAHGAILVPVGNTAQLAQAIERLVRLPALREKLGAVGLERFTTAFSAETMAHATVAFYHQVIANHAATQVHANLVYQVMEALDTGDAVSNITRRNAQILAELGQPSAILARYAQTSIEDETRPLRHALSTPDCGLIFHYWGLNSSAWLLQAVRGPKAIHYHNITPSRFFSPDSLLYRNTMRGYEQLQEIADSFDLVIGDSRYNIIEFSQYLSQPRPTIHLYPVIEPGEMAAAPTDPELLAMLRQSSRMNIVFVGRIARNKRQDQLIRLFDYYYREINRHAELWLVGSDTGDPEYRAEIEQLRESLRSRNHIRLTGKVSESEVQAYYQAADIFLCASEHEGFCMPIVQAMALDVPVLAYNAAAVPETMGDAGVLIHEWDTPRVAELMHLILSDDYLRQRMRESQRSNLRRFSVAEARTRLEAIIKYLQHGQLSPLFEPSNSLISAYRKAELHAYR